MTDNLAKEKRSEIMRRIKSHDSKIEVLFRKTLWKKGLRYRKNSAKYFGKPDLVLKKYKTVIFIDSCFWHGCKTHLRMPKTRIEYWNAKISRNIKRDIEVNEYYKKIGWKLFRLWEHQISNKANIEEEASKIIQKIKN